MIHGHLLGKAEDGFEVTVDWEEDGVLEVYDRITHHRSVSGSLNICIEDGEVILRYTKKA